MTTIRYNAALKKTMAEQHITGTELARKTHIPRAYISRLLNGSQILSRAKLALIAETLNRSIGELFGE